jgi:hypothetical protein
MPTEIEKRERLADKCLELSQVALEQSDHSTFQRLFRSSYRLRLANLAALRLESPKEFERQLEKHPAVTQFICDGLAWGGRELLIEYGFSAEVLLLEDDN